jgi:hypothetical protein
MLQTTTPVKFKYSHAVKKIRSRKYKGLGRTEDLRDADEIEKTKAEYRIGLSTIIDNGILDSRIEVYRHWFNFVVLALELEQQEAVLLFKKNEHKISVDRSMYVGWDIDKMVSMKFNDWFKSHRHLFITDISKMLSSKDKVSSDKNKVTIEFDANRRLSDVIADLRNINKQKNIFRGESDGFKSNFIVNGRVIEATLKNRYNALVLKLENNLSNEEILTHEKNYIRATSKSVEGYKSQQDQSGTDGEQSVDNTGAVVETKVDTRSELEKRMYPKLADVYQDEELDSDMIASFTLNDDGTLDAKDNKVIKPKYAYTIHELINGSPSTIGAKQILLSVCDGYFLKHPTKTYD